MVHIPRFKRILKPQKYTIWSFQFLSTRCQRSAAVWSCSLLLSWLKEKTSPFSCLAEKLFQQFGNIPGSDNTDSHGLLWNCTKKIYYSAGRFISKLKLCFSIFQFVQIFVASVLWTIDARSRYAFLFRMLVQILTKQCFYSTSVECNRDFEFYCDVLWHYCDNYENDDLKRTATSFLRKKQKW